MSANQSYNDRMASLRAHQARRNQPPSISPSVAAALRIAQAYARGGSIAPGLPVAPFQPIAAPHTVMPRIAAAHVPRILPMARGHFADGGSTLPPHVLHALAIVQDHARQHFDDGGDVMGSLSTSPSAGQFGNATTENMQLGGLQLGGGEGSALASLTGDPSGGASASTIGGTITPGGSATGAPAGSATGWQPPTLRMINNNAPLGYGDRQPTGIAVPGGNAGGPPSAGQVGQTFVPPTVRPQFARGGSTLHPSVLRALALVNQPRGHFDDGGDAGGGGNGGGNGGDGSGNGGGDGSGPGGGDVSGNSNTGGGGFSSGAASGSDSAGPSNGGGFSSGASSGADSASSTGSDVGGIGGAVTGAAASDASASTSAPASNPYGSLGSMSQATASAPSASQQAFGNIGADGQVSGSMAASAPGGFAPGSNVAGTNMGFGATDGFSAPSPSAVAASVTSNPYGSMPAGMTGVTSGMAPSATDAIAGSMQSPAPGAFGSFGPQSATPAAMSNPAGFTTGDFGASPTNQGLATNPFGSMQQHAASDAGEDGTTGLGGVGLASAMSSFGPNPSSPYGSLSTGFGTTGTAPSSVATTDSNATAGLSPSAQAFGGFGMNGYDAGIAAGTSYGTAGLNGQVSGFGDQNVAGFDNIGANGAVTGSSFGPTGFSGTGGFEGLGGTGVSDATTGNLGDPGYAMGNLGLGMPSATEDTSAPAPTAGFTPDPAVMATFNNIQQNGLALGPGPGLGTGTSTGTDTSAPLGGAPVGDAGVTATSDPNAVDGLHAVTIHGDIQSAPQTNFGTNVAPTGQSWSGDPTQGAVPAGAVNGFDFDGYTHAMQNVEDPTGDPNAVSPTGAFGLSQFTPGTWAGLRTNYPGLGLPATPQQATATQQAAATNALTAENIAGLQKNGITPTFGAAYLAHNAGISAAVSALSASDDSPISASIPASTTSVNPAVYGGIQTIGQLKSRLSSLMGGDGTFSGPGLGVNAPNSMAPGVQPATFSPSGFTFGAPTASYGNVATTTEQAPTGFAAPAPAPAAPTMTPSAYAPSATEAAAINAAGYDANPVNGMAYSTFGPQVGYSVVASPSDTPIGDLGIPSSVIAQHQSLFSGVQTVGELRSNIATAAATAGPAVASSAPSDAASAVATTDASPVTVTRSTPVSVGLGAYAGPGGWAADTASDPTAYGLGLIAANVPSYTSNIGSLGMAPTPGAQAPSNLAGWSDVGMPVGVNSFTSMAINQPGFQAENAPTSSTTTTSQPATGQPATTSDATTDTPAPDKTLTVNKTAANLAANVAMGAFGPLGMIGAGANTLSGFLGGPTVADAVNAALGHPGAPASAAGNGNSSGTGNIASTYYQNLANGTSSGSSSSAPAPASNDPYSDAMEAYLTTMLADGTGSNTAGGSSNLGVTNALQNNRISRAPLQPIYRPLEDPTVLRALGMIA